MEEYFTIAQAAEQLGISLTRLHYWRMRGALHVVKRLPRSLSSYEVYMVAKSEIERIKPYFKK